MTLQPIRILGLDPGLRNTGWGIVDAQGSRLSFVACGSVHSDGKLTLADRLRQLHDGLTSVVHAHMPHEAAVEETFVNRDPQSTLKLGQARGIALLVPALTGIPVAEYAANLVKKTVVGAGHAGIEAALACARMGLETLVLTLKIDATGRMSCNPAMGGLAKGLALNEAADDVGAAFASSTIVDVDASQKRVKTADEDELEYDALVLAVGAEAVPVVPPALTWDDRA